MIPVEYGVMTTGIAAFHRVIAFDALFGVVAVFAFLDDEPVAADAAITLVEHGEIIRNPLATGMPGSGKRAGSIGEERNEDSVLPPVRW